MWARVVANKFLHGPLGNSCFATEPPRTEMVLEFKGSDCKVMPERSQSVPKENLRDSSRQIITRRSLSEPMETLKYKLYVSTWNVGGMLPGDDLNLEDWLDTKNKIYDIYVLGFQEIVPLSAKNVLAPDNRRASMKWNSLIRAALNGSSAINPAEKEFELIEEDESSKQKIHPEKNNGTAWQDFPQQFKCIMSKRMVGIMISVWVRSDLRRYIHSLSVSCIGCGLLGYLGNKGSVSVRFCLHETSFCFVCCHLASGGKDGDELHRKWNAMEIFSRTIFPQGPSLDLPQRILDHDRVILLGDLNYRISLPEGRTRSLAEEKKWSLLLQNDQLRNEIKEGGAFEGWEEGPINFSPTYKYYPNSDKYYGYCRNGKGERRRAPAWCDRILWYGCGLKQHQYEKGESRLSDHRPVRAIFTVEVKAKTNFLNCLRSFISDRFDGIKSNLDVFFEDDVKSGRPSAST